jgi:hypothetical protein
MLGYDGVCSSMGAHKMGSNISYVSSAANMYTNIAWRKLSPGLRIVSGASLV